MITAQIPWYAVPQHAIVVLPQGMRYVVDPRTVAAVVVLYEAGADRYTVVNVHPSAPVTVLLPELPDALRFLSQQFEIEVIHSE